jgi:hypothetical protein
VKYREWNIFQAGEIKYSRTLGGYTRIDQLSNEDITK